MSIAIGGLLFPTEDAMAGPPLAVELAGRGFESLWVAEHSHIPIGDAGAMAIDGPDRLAKMYYRAMDPFVYLATAATAEVEIGLGTGICLAMQRDPIQTAKLVASIDQVSGGRFLFGVGAGWHAEEMRNHGTDPERRFKVLRERIEAMQAIWTNDTAEYHGEFVDFGPMQAWPKPFQIPHPPVLVGGTWPGAAQRALRWGDGWFPRSDVPGLVDHIPAYREMARAAGREPSVTVLIADPAHLPDIEAAAPDRIIVGIPPFDGDRMRAALDGYDDLIERTSR